MRIGIVSRPRVADMIRRAVTWGAEHEVAWTVTRDGDVVDRCTNETPDLVLMDLQMTEMDAVEATRRIMTTGPCPILLVVVGDPADAGRVFEAVGHGALDAVEIPALEGRSLNDIAAPLLAKIAAVSRLIGDVNGHRASADHERRTSPAPVCHSLIAIGASAGGPTALATVLSGLPTHLPAAVVIVQHMDEQFTQSIAELLGRRSGLPVSVAREGDRPTAGRVLVAGTGDHLTLKGSDRLGYTPHPMTNVYRPSIDVFFESVSESWRGDVVGVLLTGMGKDGARGLKALRDRGRHTIAQDEATSAVYGMPKAAAALDAATEILPIQRIAGRLVEEIVGVRPGRRVGLARNRRDDT